MPDVDRMCVPPSSASWESLKCPDSACMRRFEQAECECHTRRWVRARLWRVGPCGETELGGPGYAERERAFLRAEAPWTTCPTHAMARNLPFGPCSELIRERNSL